ncbi:MAG: hypothetical protein Q4B59_01360 [Lachnospiraceae bacterium]|nr:hypothetical protein [Lachnospiraceae bacterium]
MTVEQKLQAVVRNILTLLALAFLAVMVNADRIFENDSIIHYVLRGTWQSVLNMTKDYSIVACKMSIEYGEDLIYVEKVLSRELDKIAGKLPTIKEGPFYTLKRIERDILVERSVRDFYAAWVYSNE